MSTSAYPPYVDRLLQQAEELRHELAGQPDAAALCYEVLALFPEHTAATELVYKCFCDPQLITDTRRALSRNIDEWDDRHWQERRRLALSYRFMSRWELPGLPEDSHDLPLPNDVADMLNEGSTQLLQDYLLGQTKGAEAAWHIFQEGCKRTNDPRTAYLWVGNLYADQGYFAEAVDVLSELLAHFPNAEAERRLWAEVRWWRDNQERIPWIPAPSKSKGNGRRYERIMTQIDPEFVADDTPILEHMPPNPDNLPDDFQLPPGLPEALVNHLSDLLGALPTTNDNADSPVDWRFLDDFDNKTLDIAHFPAWAQYLLLEIDDPQQELLLKTWLLNFLHNPPTT